MIRTVLGLMGALPGLLQFAPAALSAELSHASACERVVQMDANLHYRLVSVSTLFERENPTLGLEVVDLDDGKPYLVYCEFSDHSRALELVSLSIYPTWCDCTGPAYSAEQLRRANLDLAAWIDGHTSRNIRLPR